MKKPLPIWLTLIIIIETLPMFIGPLLALFNPSAMPVFRIAPGSEDLAWIYAARNFAVGIAFILAFALKDRNMLFILILIRFITDLHDLPTGLYYGGFSSASRAIAIFVLLYYLPAVYALRYLWKEMKADYPSKQSNG